MVSVLLRFLISLIIDQYFDSLSISETIFQTLSTGADSSRLTLISSKELAKAVGACQIVVVKIDAIVSAADIVTTTFLLECFLCSLFFSFLGL
jgi:hypothetical protein